LRDISKDGLTVADRIVAIDDIGQLTAWRLRGVKNMLVAERHARQLEECKYLQAIAVIVGDAEQRGVGVKREHGELPLESNFGTSSFLYHRSMWQSLDCRNSAGPNLRPMTLNCEAAPWWASTVKTPG